MITGSLLYILSLLFLLRTSYMESQKKHYIFAKTMTSIGFLALAGISLYFSKAYPYFYALLPGLLFCLCGDVFLAIRLRTKQFKWLVFGITMFVLAHVTFIFGLQKYTNWNWWDFSLPLISVVMVFILFRLPKIEPGKGEWPSLIYSYFVSLFFLKAIEIMYAWNFSRQGIFLAIGAMFFFISDVLLIFLYFSKKPQNWLHGANLITYYLGVAFLASSIYFG